MAAERAACRLAACAGAALAAGPWRRPQRAPPPPRCEGPPRGEALLPGRGAFISGRESTDVHAVYSFADTIGEGGFGRVVRATHRRTGIQRAIKVIPKRDNADGVRNEIHALSELDHPHIVKLVEYFEDSRRFYLVQALIDGPDLAELLGEGVSEAGAQRGSPLPEREVSIVIRDCLRSAAGCHARGIVHRDLKLDNFMVAGSGGVVKVIDFGLAARCGLADGTAGATPGTYVYRAPEVMVPRWRRARTARRARGGGGGGAVEDDEAAGPLPPDYGKAVDVWSLGVMLFALLTGEPLFPRSLGERAVQDRLADPKHVPDRLRYCQALKACSPEARDLLSRMLRRDPRERITTAEALQHPFVLRYYHEILGGRERDLEDVRPDPALLTRLVDFARAPRLHRVALLAMTHLASEQSGGGGELCTLRQTFRLLDGDGDGRISLRELQSLEQYGAWMPEDPDDLREAFQACDTGGTGHMNFVQFIACSLPRALITEQLCTEAFMILDRNHSGDLDAEDLRLLAEQPARCEGQDYQAIIDEAEAAVRGADGPREGRLTFEDFHALLRGAGAVRARLPRRPGALP